MGDRGLQWSRGPKASETSLLLIRGLPGSGASMEPRPEGLGNTAERLQAAVSAAQLQWSRGPKASETSNSGIHRRPDSLCFNGAEARRPREHVLSKLEAEVS